MTREPLGEDEDEFVPPVQRMRKSTTTYELAAEDILSEPTFEWQQMVPRRQPTSRSPIVSRQLTVAKQPTVHGRRATFESAVSTPSRGSTIMSDPTAASPDSPIISRISTRQPTARASPALLRYPTSVGHRGTQDVSRQLTRQLTEIIDISAPVSRQVMRQMTIPPSRKPSEYEMLDLIQRNIEEGNKPLDEEPVDEPDDEEPLIEHQITRQPTQRFEFQEDVSPVEEDAEEEPAMSVRRDREPTRTFREPTKLEKQVTLPVKSEDAPKQISTTSSPTSIAEASPLPSRLTARNIEPPVMRMRQKTWLEELLPDEQPEPEPELLEQAQCRRTLRVPTLPTEVGVSKSPSRKPAWSSEALADEKITNEPEPVLEEVPLPEFERQASIVSRKPTVISRRSTQLPQQPTRQPTVPSRQDMLKRKMPSPDPIILPVERLATHVSRQPTGCISSPSQTSESMSSFMSFSSVIEELPALATTQATQPPTNVQRQATVRETSPSYPVPSRQATIVSRQPTAQGESPPSFVALGRTAEPQQEEETLQEAMSVPPSRKPTVQTSRKPTKIPTREDVPEEPTVSPVEDDETQDIISAPQSRKPTSRVSRQPIRVSTKRGSFEDASNAVSEEEPLEPILRTAEATVQGELSFDIT